MSGAGSWREVLYAGGVTPASFLPDRGIGRGVEPEETPGAGVEMVETDGLGVHPVALVAAPPVVTFLDGIQQWKVIGYDGVRPIAQAYVAAAARRRTDSSRRRLHTTAWEGRALVVAAAAALPPQRRAAVERAGLAVVVLQDADALSPGPALDAMRRAVQRARQEVERSVGERVAAGLAAGEWLVMDGQLAVSARLARHPRAVGVVKSHGAQFLEGRHLERALTVPAGHRTSVFRVLGGHGRTEVDSWYLRLWPWEGKDLHFGLLRLEAAAGPASGVRAAALSGWLLAERAPLATPDARFDRLLYPIHDVETYLRSRAPGDLAAAPDPRLPRTGT